MIKRQQVLALAAIMVLGLVACKNEEVKEPQTVIIKPFDYTVSVKVVDSWRVDKEDGTRDYFLTLFASSESMYAPIEEDDVCFYTDDGYKTLEESIYGSDVSVININDDTKKGVVSFITIKTINLIDTKKINVSFDGPSEYDAECLDKESYEAKHGKGSWGSVMSKVSSSAYAASTVSKMQSGMRYGVLCPVDGDGFSLALYFDQRDDSLAKPIVDGSKCYIEFEVTSLNNRDVASYNQYFESMMIPKTKTAIDEGTVELDKNIATYAEYIDGKMRFGYQTVDGSDISTHVESFPEWIAIVYSNGASYLKFK